MNTVRTIAAAAGFLLVWIQPFSMASASVIRLAAGTVDTSALSGRNGLDGDSAYRLIQFDGPVQDSWLESCRAAGIELLDYVPDFAFIARVPRDRRQAISELPHLAWTGPWLPGYRVSPSLRNRGAAARKVVFVLFPGVDPEPFREAVGKVGGEVTATAAGPWKTRVLATVPGAGLEELAAEEGVKWVEPAPRWDWHNNKASEIVGASVVRSSLAVYGSGETVGIADSGIDRGSKKPSELLADFLDGSGSSRVTAIVHLSTAVKDMIGHGTHVAGTILGNGKLSGATPSSRVFPSTCYAGIAPEAELVVQNIADLNGNITGLPDDLNVLFAQAYGGGARIHNDSWGEIGTNGYTSYSEDVDEFIWDNPEFSVVFSAGNSGIDADASGVVDGSSINAPANAKNCIAVGAGENDRDESSTPEPAYNAAYGWFWPWDYPAAPISDDHVSNHPEGLAAFSSRGPTLDGRFKPEIVAPGTNVVSCRSHAIDLSQSVLWGPGGLSGSLSEYYTFSGGTSMAAPLVTGAAALVRERYRTAFGAVPSAALIKATLLNGARDTTPGQYGTGAAREVPPAPRPNNVEGWGRLDLPSSAPLQDEGDFYYFQATPGLSTGGEDSYRISVSPMLAALSVTLAWSDYPGSAPAGGALVNDLDLTVAGPGGQVYYPNRATAAEGLVYDDGTVEDEQTGFLGVVEAVRFTPSRYPARLDEGVFYLGSTAGSYPAETGIRVYRGDASGPKELLWSGNRTVTAPGWQSVDFSGEGIAVASGDIFLGVAPLDDDLFWAADVDLETAGRTWQYVPGSGWVKIPILDALIRARTTATSVQDRTNNVETVDIDLPAPGVYTLRVRGYNVPCGPQPYALVAARPAWTAENAPERFVIASGDYDGDGTADPAVFRWSDGLWSARGLTRFYFGRMGDYPASGDYDGDGTTDAAVFRPATGMWSARSLTRFWLGDDESVPVPGDYDADGTADGAVFGSADGLWRIRGQSAFYYGRSGDVPVPARYEAGVSAPTRAAVYRPSSGLWALRGLTGYHYGGAEDIPLPGDYDVFPGADLAVFNPDTGRWAMYAFTRFYLGKEGDEPVPADYAGTGVDKFGVFRPGSGRWVVRGLTAFYYGDSRSIPVTR